MTHRSPVQASSSPPDEPSGHLCSQCATRFTTCPFVLYQSDLQLVAFLCSVNCIMLYSWKLRDSANAERKSDVPL